MKRGQKATEGTERGQRAVQGTEGPRGGQRAVEETYALREYKELRGKEGHGGDIGP